MATGDSADMLARLKSTLPARWFNDQAINAPSVLGSIGDQLAAAYSLFQFVVKQTRIATASGVFLDLISLDFLGLNLRRRTSESDGTFRARIQKEILRTRVTRAGVIQSLTDLTGRVPKIFEPARPQDTGAYRTGGAGYGVAGGYGSLQMPNQALVKAYRPLTAGIPNIGGYRLGGAYRNPSPSAYANIAASGAFIADADIDAAIEATKPLGTRVWVQINS